MKLFNFFRKKKNVKKDNGDVPLMSASSADSKDPDTLDGRVSDPTNSEISGGDSGSSDGGGGGGD